MQTNFRKRINDGIGKALSRLHSIRAKPELSNVAVGEDGDPLVRIAHAIAKKLYRDLSAGEKWQHLDETTKEVISVNDAGDLLSSLGGYF